MTTVTVPDPQALADGPADEVLPLYVAAAGPADVDRAVEAARAAMSGPWGSTLAMDRASTETGKRIAARAASTLKPATFELGGKSPNIVFPDADLEIAVQRSAYRIFSAGGQSCIAASRTLVHRGVLDEFSERFGARASAIRVGDPFAERSQVGAQTSERQLRKIESYVGIARDEGAQVVSGGAPPDDASGAGYFYRPTVLGAVTNDMRVAREEIFGPVTVLIGFDDEEEAIALANDTRMVWPRRYGRATSSALTGSPTPCRRGRCGSTTTGCGTG